MSESKLSKVTPEMNPVPLMVTLTVCPVPPLSGTALVIVGSGLTTENAAGKTVDPPPGPEFVTLTFLVPATAVDAIDILATTDVELLKVVERTVTPSPKPALLESRTKLVPVSVTSSVSVLPPEAGEMAERVGTGFVTLKIFDFATVPPPGAGFVTDTVRAPRTASAATLICTVIVEEFATETDVTVTPLPKVTEVRPLWNPVP